MNNTESFNNTSNYKLKKTSKVGIMILSLVVAGAVVTSSINQMKKDNTPKDVIEEIIPQFSTNTTLEEINNMNIIINDDDCSDTFFNAVTDKLREDGIVFTTTKNEVDINQNNSTIITLDQQYSAGPGTIIFAPYDNARVGQSDSLALAMQASFHQNGFIGNDIVTGKAGFQEDGNGNVQYYFPTSTESAINEGYESSYVTISFGTENINAEWVAKSIENGLARQNYYLKNEDNQTDLIVRANPTDSVDTVAQYFGTDPYSLKKYNNIDEVFKESQTVVNPAVKDMKAFDPKGMYNLEEQKTRAY